MLLQQKILNKKKTTTFSIELIFCLVVKNLNLQEPPKELDCVVGTADFASTR